MIWAIGQVRGVNFPTNLKGAFIHGSASLSNLAVKPGGETD